MSTLFNDIKYGFRMLTKNPGFTAIALITLAIGIGANTIMFSLVNVLILRPVLVQEPDRLVECKARNAFFPYAVYVDIRDNNPSFTDLIAYAKDLNLVTLMHENVTRRVTSTFVSANYFSVLGVRPALGRWFSPDDELHGAEPVVVLSYRTWRQQGANPEIIGKQVTIDGTVFRIIGIAPKRFTGTAVIGPNLWLPLGTYGLIGHQGRENTRQRTIDFWNYPFLTLIGRLKPGMDMTAAQAQIQSIIPRLRQNYPRPWGDNASLHLHHLSRLTTDTSVNDRFILALVSLFLMAVPALVLLIACLNLGNMIVVQGSARCREIAIRLAIGGGRLRIIRQLLIESLLLAILGGALGCVFALWGTKILNAWVTSPHLIGLSADLQIGLDVRVLAATFGFCLIATILFGLKPALRLSKRDIIADIKESGSETARLLHKKWRFVPRGLSVIGQIALSVVLVMGAALFTRSALYTARVDPGFSLDNKLLVQVDPLAAGYDRARSIQVYETLTEHLGSMSGVEATAVSTSFPFCGGGDYGTIIVEYTPGTEENEDSTSSSRFKKPMYGAHSIRGDFFDAMGIPLLQGRYFNRLDNIPDAEKVVIIDEYLAHKLRPDGNAIGCLIQFGFLELLSPYRIVGIVPNVRSGIREQEHLPQIYIPITTDQLPRFIHLRVADGISGTTLLDKVTAEIHRADPKIAILSVTTLAQEHLNSGEVYAAQLGARMAVVFGAMALFLASLGIYAVKGYMVASRTPEIGIRKALGATHKDIMGMVFLEGAALTLAGLIVGLLLGLVIARLIGSMFYGVSPIDPYSIVMTIILLSLASLLAGYIPARRAAKIDPMVALRYE